MDAALILALFLAAAGLALGWYLGSRQAAAFRKERDERLDDFRRAITDLAAAEERAKQVPLLQQQLEAIRSDCNAARSECGATPTSSCALRWPCSASTTCITSAGPVRKRFCSGRKACSPKPA